MKADFYAHGGGATWAEVPRQSRNTYSPSDKNQHQQYFTMNEGRQESLNSAQGSEVQSPQYFPSYLLARTTPHHQKENTQIVFKDSLKRMSEDNNQYRKDLRPTHAP